jgi:ClpP class serine protease
MEISAINKYLGGFDWAIDEKYLGKMASRLELALPAVTKALSEFQLKAESGGLSFPIPNYIQKVSEDTAILNIKGALYVAQSPIDDLMAMFFGGTNTERLGANIDQLTADPNIKNILVDVDSGGGQVALIDTTANKLAQLSKTKNVRGFAGSYAASAAMHLLSQVPHITTRKESLLGSIGVVASWVDPTEFYQKLGVHYEQVTSDNAPLKRLSPTKDGHREAFKQPLNQLETVMIDTIAKGRGVSADFVKKNFGKGNIMSGEAAVKAGMADRIGSLEEVLAELKDGKKSASRTQTAISAEIQKEKNTMSTKKERFLAWLTGDSPDAELDALASPSVSADDEKLKAETERRIKAEAEAEHAKQELHNKLVAEQKQAEEAKQADAKAFANNLVSSGKIVPALASDIETMIAEAPNAETMKSFVAKLTADTNGSLIATAEASTGKTVRLSTDKTETVSDIAKRRYPNLAESDVAKIEAKLEDK